MPKFLVTRTEMYVVIMEAESIGVIEKQIADGNAELHDRLDRNYEMCITEVEPWEEPTG